MLGFNIRLNHKCLGEELILVSKTDSGLASVQFIGFLDLKIKNKTTEPN